MKKLIVISILTMLGSIKAQSPNINTTTKIDSILSFRLLSTGYIFEDAIDIIQNPVRLHEIDGNLFFSSLSDLKGTSTFFKDTTEDYLLVGMKNTYSSTSEALLFLLSGYEIPLPNYYGTNGHVEVDSLLRTDTDGDGNPDTEYSKYEREDANESYNSLLGYIALELKRDSYSIGTFFYKNTSSTKTKNPGTLLDPWGSFYSVSSTYDLNSQSLIQTEEGLGSDSREYTEDLSIASLGGMYIFEDSTSLNLILGYRTLKELEERKTEYDVITDYNPGGSEVHNKRSQGYYYRRFLFPGTGVEAYLQFKKPWGENNLFDAILYGMTENQEKDKDFYEIREFYTGTYDDMPLGTRYTYQEDFFDRDFSKAEKSHRILALYLRNIVKASPMFRFGIGLGFRSEVLNEEYSIVERDSTYFAFDDGDDQILDPDDYTEITRENMVYDSLKSSVINYFFLPVGIEFRPLKNKEIYLRLGSCFTYYEMQDKYTINIKEYHPPQTIITYGDSSTIITTQDTQLESRTSDSKTHHTETRFYYGASFTIWDRATLDIMNFANLTDLTNWKVQIVIRF